MKDYIRPLIMDKLLEIRKNLDVQSQLNSEDLIEALETVKCSCCMDSKILWSFREAPLASLDGRGKYNLVHCNNCSINSGVIYPVSNTNDYYQENSHQRISDRINELEVIKQKIKAKKKYQAQVELDHHAHEQCRADPGLHRLPRLRPVYVQTIRTSRTRNTGRRQRRQLTGRHWRQPTRSRA